MLRISLQSLRARRATLAGAFVALWLAVTLSYGAGLLMAAALSPPGPGAFTHADFVIRADPTVVLPGDHHETAEAIPGPRLPAGFAARVRAIPGVISATGTDPVVVRAHVPKQRLEQALGPKIQVLDHDHAAFADPKDPSREDREALIAIFSTMGGIAGLVATFVVAGTFTLAIAQRRREVAVLRALGAAPRQVRRLIAGEALIVAVIAGALGVLCGRPLADALTHVLKDRHDVPPGFTPSHSWLPLVAAVGLGLVISQLAVFAAARRAGKTRPAEALREVAVEHPRPSIPQLVTGVLMLGGGIAMSVIFSGIWAVAFAILGGMLLASGVGLLGRLLLGFPAALVSLPLRALGASGLLASANLAANRWRTAALATPIVLVAMLAGTQAVIQISNERHTERVTAARVLAPYVVHGRPVHAKGTATVLPTQVFGMDRGLGGDSPWTATGLSLHGAPTLDLGVTEGRLALRGNDVAVSRVFADAGKLRLGDTFHAKLSDAGDATLRVAAIYSRAAGLGDVVVPAALARAHGARPTTTFVTGHRPAGALTRAQYLKTVHAENQDQSWGVWMIVGMSVLFAALALVNTAAMSTGDRRRELATVRLLGGTAGQAVRTTLLELVPTLAVALVAGAAVVAVSVAGVPRGLSGFPLTVPLELVGGLAGGAALLGLLAGLVATRLTLLATPLEAMRARE